MNTMSTGLANLAYKRIWFYLLLIVASVCPGSIILYMFQRCLFTSLDSIRYVIISISLTAPIIVFNTVCYDVWNTVWNTVYAYFSTQKDQNKDQDIKKKQDSEDKAYQNIFVGSIFSLFIFYIAIIIIYVLSSFKIIVYFLSYFEIFLLLVFILEVVFCSIICPMYVIYRKKQDGAIQSSKLVK